MRIAVIGDVHANLPALRAVLDDAVRIECAAIFCVGDVVGRGPHPNEVIEELRRLEIPTVQGNWDEAVGMDRETSGSLWATADHESGGHASLAWTIRQISDENRTWLRHLPATLRAEIEGRSAFFFHGSPLKQTEYLWSDRPSRYFARIASDEADDIFCFGHTHESFHRLVGQSHFVAAGSVGCGGETDARARYAVVYVGQPDIAIGFRSVEYDHASVARDMLAVGLSVDLMRVPPVAHPHEPLPQATRGLSPA